MFALDADRVSLTIYSVNGEVGARGRRGLPRPCASVERAWPHGAGAPGGGELRTRTHVGAPSRGWIVDLVYTYNRAHFERVAWPSMLSRIRTP